MYIYNLSIKILPEIETAWLRWMQDEHMNEVLETGMFDHYHLFELIEPVDDEGKTYIVQYFTTSIERYQNYIEEYANGLREKGYKKFGDRFIAFRSVMKKNISSENIDSKHFQ